MVFVFGYPLKTLLNRFQKVVFGWTTFSTVGFFWPIMKKRVIVWYIDDAINWTSGNFLLRIFLYLDTLLLLVSLIKFKGCSFDGSVLFNDQQVNILHISLSTFSLFISYIVEIDLDDDMATGVWFMHCHIEAHTSWGLRMAWVVMDGKLPNQKLLPPPSDLPKCWTLTLFNITYFIIHGSIVCKMRLPFTH